MRTTPGQRWSVAAIAGVLLGTAGVAVSLAHAMPDAGAVADLVALAVFGVASGLWLSFATPNRTGAIVVINPAVCFSFAILLSWGLLPALSAHLVAVIAFTWRHRLPPIRGVLLVVQFALAFSAAYGLLRLDTSRGPGGREWTAVDDVATVVAAAAAWLIVYIGFSYLVAWRRLHGFGVQVPTPTINALLFNGALIVLSPAVAIVADINVVLAALVLLPLYTTQRMAALALERDRTNRLDPLTSLGNRVMLRESFNRLVADSDDHADRHPHREDERRRSTNWLALLLLDLDRFKYVNDSLGYEVGDQLLMAVAGRLTTVHNGGQTIVRLSGDEFAVLATVPDADAANDLAYRTVEAMREPVQLDGLLVDVTASVGLTTRRCASGEDLVALLRHADSAMYDAKRQGDEVAVYHDRGGDEAPEQLTLLSDFRTALSAVDSDEVTMHYQPQLSFATGAIEGLEALLRWTHPVRGPIDAATVLGLAEHTAVMHLLTARVIDKVISQLALWRSAGLHPRVAVNISARDLYSDSIIAQLSQRLSEQHLPPHQLQIEITESAVMADPTRARRTMNRISQLGIDISLDDFGTGYSSLQYLRRMPLRELKVDQVFVKGMTRNQDDAAIVASTIKLAHALDLRTVAEGVEDEATSVRLRELGCDLGQGWYFSRAVPADEVPGLITQPPALPST